MGKPEDGLGVLLALGKPKAGGSAASEDGEESARALAARAFLKAVKASDPRALAEAFDELLACCDEDDGMEHEPEDEDLDD